MPKAVLSNRIFLEVDAHVESEIRKALTYEIPLAYSPTGKGLPRVEIVKTFIKVKNGLYSIPIGRLDLIPEGYEIVDKRITNLAKFPAFAGDLREEQQKVYDSIEGNAILNAWVSFGKTFTALALAGKFKQKTLVVTHTVYLRDQWVTEIEKVYGFTPGIIGSGKFELDSPIVVGNVQTLEKKITDLYKEFGFIILDECHHCPSTTFAKIVDKSAAKYKLGLSGTLKRKDGKHIVLPDYFGANIIQPPKENYMVPEVHIHKAPFRFIDGDSQPWAKKVNKLLYNEGYQKYVTLLAAAYASKGHKVLVVADRVEFISSCADLLGNNCVSVTGASKNRDELVQKIKDNKVSILIGTQSIFSEGISVNELSCLILATPVNNESLITQLVGRVIRLQEGKLTPVVVDINLVGKTANNQAKSRLGVYIQEGWKVVT